MVSLALSCRWLLLLFSQLSIVAQRMPMSLLLRLTHRLNLPSSYLGTSQ